MSLCKIKNCERPSRFRGLCFTHNQRWKKGEPDYDRPIIGKGGAKKIPETDRFEKFVDRTPTCWGWNGFVDSIGRGHFFIYEIGKVRAHRASYILNIGPIPNNLVVCHSCDNPNCVNPDHLWLGTIKENVHDMLAKGREHRRGRYCINNHDTELPNAIRYVMQRGKRVSVCIECAKARQRRYEARLKQKDVIIQT